VPSQADRRAATVAKILAGARRLFATRGFEQASIDDIAPISPEVLKARDPASQIAAAVLSYLLAASDAEVRRILLIDGPAVIGWRKWREIDDRFFGAGARSAVKRLLGEAAAAREVEATVHLLMGAVMEAALRCAAADDPEATARDLSSALERMLRGIARNGAG